MKKSRVAGFLFIVFFLLNENAWPCIQITVGSNTITLPVIVYGGHMNGAPCSQIQVDFGGNSVLIPVNVYCPNSESSPYVYDAAALGCSMPLCGQPGQTYDGAAGGCTYNATMTCPNGGQINPSKTNCITDSIDPCTSGACTGQIRIFEGKPRRCKMAGTDTNWQNCCNASPGSWLFLNAICDEEDKLTVVSRNENRSYELSNRCAKKWPLIGGCMQEYNVACDFHNELAKIIQVYGRPQLTDFVNSGSWGSPDNPNCIGFTTEQFKMLKLDEEPLKSAIETYFQQKAPTGLSPAVQQSIDNKVKDFYQKLQ